MSRLAAAGATAFFVAASSFAHAQTPAPAQAPTQVSPPAQAATTAVAPEHARASDRSALIDARLNVVKATLALTPDQEKFWPAIDEAVRARVKNRQARIENAAKRVDELREQNPMDVLSDRDPVAFLQRRADALTQRAADLKKVANAWQPLYQTLTPDQKRRLGFLTVVVLREMREALQERPTGTRVMIDRDDDEED